MLQVLSGDPGAPADLRDKAIAYAGQILEWDPALHGASGTERARELLASGAARAAFEAIATAQGRQPIAAAPGSYVREVVAARAGVIEGFRGYIISGLARAAGAPSDKAAGVDILAALGDTVRAGQPLLRVHASQDAALARAFNEHAAQGAVVLR